MDVTISINTIPNIEEGFKMLPPKKSIQKFDDVPFAAKEFSKSQTKKAAIFKLN